MMELWFVPTPIRLNVPKSSIDKSPNEPVEVDEPLTLPVKSLDCH